MGVPLDHHLAIEHRPWWTRWHSEASTKSEIIVFGAKITNSLTCAPRCLLIEQTLNICQSNSTFTCDAPFNGNFDNCIPELFCTSVTNDVTRIGPLSAPVPWSPATLPTEFDLFPTLIDMLARVRVPCFASVTKSSTLYYYLVSGTIPNYNLPLLQNLYLLFHLR